MHCLPSGDGEKSRPGCWVGGDGDQSVLNSGVEWGYLEHLLQVLVCAGGLGGIGAGFCLCAVAWTPPWDVLAKVSTSGSRLPGSLLSQ